MLKINNQKVISDIAKTTYKANIKRNILTVTAIFLTTFLISVILSLGGSYWNTIMLRQTRMSGMDYTISLSEPRADQVAKIRSMDTVKYAGVEVKCAIGSQYKDKQLEKLRFYWLDDTCWTKQTIPALEEYTGTYPEKENEILLSQSALSDMGITNPQIGMELPISYSVLQEDLADELMQTNFRLCGWFKDYSGRSCAYISNAFYKSTGVLQTDFTQGTLNISLVNPLYSEKDIINMQKEINLADKQFIDADHDTISNFCKLCIGLFGMLVLIFFSGYLFIYNTMYISVTKDIRYYGQLKTLGMTSVQLKKLVYTQVLWNSFIGIPFGLAASALVAKVIIPRVIHIANPTIPSNEVMAVQLWVFIAAAIFAFITTLVSSNKPVKMAKDCPPIEALQFVTVTPKNKHKRRENGTAFSMAMQNIFRDKKQAVIILFSLSIAVSLFFVVNVVIKENDARLILNSTYTYDLELLNQTMLDENKQHILTDNMISQIEQINGVKEVRKVSSTTAVVPYQEEVYGEYYRKLYASRYSPGNYEDDIATYKKDPANNWFTCRLIGIDKNEFTRINHTMEKQIDASSFENGSIALVSKFAVQGDVGIPSKTVRFSLPEGLEPGKEYSTKIADIISDNPAYFAGGYTPDLIVSESFAKKLLGNTFTELITIEYNAPLLAETERAILEIIAENKLVTYNSKLERYTEMKNTEGQIKILGGSAGIIILLLAVMNYLNMMAASIQNRTKEFAILESIGMTSRQIKVMIVLEGSGYAVLSILISTVVGIPLSYAVFSGLNIYGLPFLIPWTNNIILYVVILLICVIAPILIFKRIHRPTIIEQLRESLL